MHWWVFNAETFTYHFCNLGWLLTCTRCKMFYLKAGTGEPWAGQSNANCVKAFLSIWLNLMSVENLGEDPPIGSKQSVKFDSDKYELKTNQTWMLAWA